MRPLLFAGTILLLLYAAPDRRKAYEKALPSTVMVEATDGHGTGVWVSENHVLTAAHVADGPVVVLKPDGTRLKCCIVKSDPSIDLALLRVEGQGIPMGLGREPAVEDDLFTIGCSVPFGFNKGHCRSTYHTEFSTVRGDFSGNVVDISVPVSLGDSGGPLVDKSGRLVGIVISIDAFRNQANLAVSVTEVRKFLEAQ